MYEHNHYEIVGILKKKHLFYKFTFPRHIYVMSLFI